MSDAAHIDSQAGRPKLTLPITPRTLNSVSSSNYEDTYGSHEESYNTDVVFRDTNEVDHDVCSPGKRDEHRRRFESFESWDSASDSCSSRDGALSDGVDEGNMLFMSYEASHELRELRATREVQHYGGMRVFRGLWGMVFYIGPHWYAILVMIGVILGIGFGFTFMLTPGLQLSETQQKLQKFIGTFLTMISLLTFLRCALVSDPGILQAYPEEANDTDDIGEEQWLPSHGMIYCRRCKVMQRKGTLHCEYCRVCIDEFDHHCPWIGKCVGGGNVTDFYIVEHYHPANIYRYRPLQLCDSDFVAFKKNWGGESSKGVRGSNADQVHTH
ncbi:zinc finger protein DHHC domain containing protein, putative [Perkinsus marinus ATCC 50983]|uniref:Palmitoyltransferase n=1 Tax=Perkinsus marinus (strain ATCC 50983 / TXsc) TaxID=423536 RepID=C5L1K2_PERM5|nr:zinc finger protein DHHC domain containing protein, putative [Perkinsus marinus ATCC 50983]EER09429.1 zinc finger protein DHHC domain containing protein, putative [Perkinsus marinus ATCC 50983]|eukprot:XP_002777613.1 zinc finger protein DHHC domain containing protein, putative [Perkinsus marinus ATCC 50983]